MVRLNMMMIVHMKVTGYHGYDDHDADGHDSDNDDDDDDDNDGQDQDQDQDQAGVGVGYYLSKSQWDMLDADFSDIALGTAVSSGNIHLTSNTRQIMLHIYAHAMPLLLSRDSWIEGRAIGRCDVKHIL